MKFLFLALRGEKELGGYESCMELTGLDQGQHIFFKGQIVNTLAFVGHTGHSCAYSSLLL